jgi:hypothetical protein
VAGCLSKCLTIVPPKTEWGRTLLYARRVSMPDRGEPSRVHTEEVTVEESRAATALTSGRSGRPGRAGFGTKRFRETACPQRAPVHPSSAVDSPRRSRIAQRQTTPASGHHHALDSLVMRCSCRHTGGEDLQALLRPLSRRCGAVRSPPTVLPPEDVILLADRDASHAPVVHTNERLEEALGRRMSRVTVMPNLARNRLPQSQG